MTVWHRQMLLLLLLMLLMLGRRNSGRLMMLLLLTVASSWRHDCLWNRTPALPVKAPVGVMVQLVGAATADGTARAMDATAAPIAVSTPDRLIME